jgi:membrane dipeptidase
LGSGSAPSASASPCSRPSSPREDATVDDFVAAIEHVTRVVGEDCVGIGADFTQDQDAAFFDWLTHDKGYARRLTTFTELADPRGIQRVSEFPNLTRAMEKAGWPERKIRKITGENWIRVLDEVWAH